jgi:hypothetical protein
LQVSGVVLPSIPALKIVAATIVVLKDVFYKAAANEVVRVQLHDVARRMAAGMDKPVTDLEVFVMVLVFPIRSRVGEGVADDLEVWVLDEVCRKVAADENDANVVLRCALVERGPEGVGAESDAAIPVLRDSGVAQWYDEDEVGIAGWWGHGIRKLLALKAQVELLKRLINKAT